jgi:hypothetical protein
VAALSPRQLKHAQQCSSETVYCASLGALATILDQHCAIDMTDPLLAKVFLQSRQGCRFTSAGRFPKRAHVVYMQVHEIAKRSKAGGDRLFGDRP